MTSTWAVTSSSTFTAEARRARRSLMVPIAASSSGPTSRTSPTFSASAAWAMPSASAPGVSRKNRTIATSSGRLSGATA